VKNSSLIQNDILGLFPTWEQLYAAAPEAIQKAMDNCKCKMKGYKFLSHKLTESEFYAFLASFAVYQSDKDPFGNYLQGERYKDHDSGLSYGIYVYGPGNTILAFTGTDEGIDWLANIQQGAGNSSAPQYNQLEKLFVKHHIYEMRPAVITGHSLGGGLATIAAIRLGRPEALIALNPAAPNKDVVKQIEKQKLNNGIFDMTDAKAALATSWVVDGDILTELQRPFRGLAFIKIGQVKEIKFAKKPLLKGDWLNHSACFFLYYALTAVPAGL